MKIYVSILHSALKVFSIAATCTNSRHSIFITAPLNDIFTFSVHIPTERVKESKNQPIADTHSLTHQQMDAIVLDDGILFTKNIYISGCTEHCGRTDANNSSVRFRSNRNIHCLLEYVCSFAKQCLE